jgi:hypothetical protein
MDHPPLTPKNIASTLNKTDIPYQIFHIDYTTKEKNTLKKFKVEKSRAHSYCGSNKKPEIKEFLESIGDNDKKDIDIITKIVYKLIKTVLTGYKKTHYWIAIRCLIHTNSYDIPRWHRDSPYYVGQEKPSKFVTVLKGPGTILKDMTPENKEAYEAINAERNEKVINIPIRYEEDPIRYKENREEFNKELSKIDNSYKLKYVEALKDSETKQINNDEGLIFFAKEAMHSEPKVDRERIFISIIPLDKENLKNTQMCGNQNGGYYDKLIKPVRILNEHNRMIVYITGASGSGKTTLLKSLSVKGYDLDNIYANNWEKHRKFDTVQKGVIKDINILLSKHKNIVFVGLQGKDKLPFTPDVVYILIRKDYEQYYRDKLVRDLNLLCKYKTDFEEVLKKEPFDKIKNHFWANDIVNMKTFDEFKKYVDKMNKRLKEDFPTAEILTASEIIKKINF